MERGKGVEQNHTHHGRVGERGEGAYAVEKQVVLVVAAAYEACVGGEEDEDIVVAAWAGGKGTAELKDVGVEKAGHEQREDIVDAVDENQTAAAAAEQY